MLPPKHTPVVVMLHVTENFFRPNATALDRCIETSATAKAYPIEARNCNFTFSDCDRACVMRICSSLLKTITRKILKKNFHIIEYAELGNAAKL